MVFELIHKQTFTNQLRTLPKEQILKIIEKIEVLRQSPSPQGELKKKLHGYKGDIYRLRSGDYRIIYAFGDGWVALLGVDNRKDIYKDKKLYDDSTTIDPSTVPDPADLLQPEKQQQQQARQAVTAEPDDKLPSRLDEALLAKMGVPETSRAMLVGCATLSGLYNIDVPEPVRQQILDCLTDPDFDRVLEQPSFVTGEASDLIRFVEGELIGFLLKLDPEQEALVGWRTRNPGPILVKGSPGTGKSTVALYRAKAMLNALRNTGVAKPRLLFTTYTNALVACSKQLLSRLLGPDASLVEVKTADSVAMEIVTSAGDKPVIAEQALLKQLAQDALKQTQLAGSSLERRAQTQIIDRISSEYLLEEIGAVIEAREISSLESYQNAPRNGRTVRLDQGQREVVWKVYQTFVSLLAKQQRTTWHQIRRRAADLMRQGHYKERFDGILIDEAQDLDPTALRMLVLLGRSPSNLFITADANQSIYGSSFRWADVHTDLKFQGKTALLKTNHRSTRELNEATRSYLRNGAIENEEIATNCPHEGPQPTVRRASATEEVSLLQRFLPAAAKLLRLGLGSCAVLVPSETTGRALAQRLSTSGINAAFMPGKEIDLGSKAVKIITMKSAKGLEFPVVVVAGFSQGSSLSVPPDPEEAKESNERTRRTIFVAMTRAMRALLVILPENHSSPLFEGFTADLWNTK